jgi:hemerythrin superfamily protein
MKATRLLVQQHRQVKDLFGAIERSNATNRRQLVNELATALAAHMVIEEETFYPMTLNIRRDLVPVAQEEQDLAGVTLSRVVSCPTDDELLMARVQVLRTLVEEHTTKEETDLFPSVEAAIDDAQLEAMGQQMENRFNQMIKLSPQAVLAARPTAGIQCPGMPHISQPVQHPGQQPAKGKSGQQPTKGQATTQQPTKGQAGQEQAGQQQPGQQQTGPAKGRGKPAR